MRCTRFGGDASTISGGGLSEVRPTLVKPKSDAAPMEPLSADPPPTGTALPPALPAVPRVALKDAVFGLSSIARRSDRRGDGAPGVRGDRSDAAFDDTDGCPPTPLLCPCFPLSP
jgi:hypothetical protein